MTTFRAWPACSVPSRLAERECCQQCRQFFVLFRENGAKIE